MSEGIPSNLLPIYFVRYRLLDYCRLLNQLATLVFERIIGPGLTTVLTEFCQCAIGYEQMASEKGGAHKPIEPRPQMRNSVL
jgi:hypothetical protein